MLAIFSLRLAFGLLACLLILPSAVVNPRFYRTHFLTALGLVVMAVLFPMAEPGAAWWAALIAGGLVCIAGSMIYLLEGAPGGKLAIAGGLGLIGLALYLTITDPSWSDLVNHATAAGVLGSALTAMLMGHSYLIAPSMSLTPLLRLLALLAGSLILRMVLVGYGLWSLTNLTGTATLGTETILWLVVRWAVGFLLPLVLCWMAWETTRIRSTQSATGILYVVVILCFLGELTSQVLQSKTGYIL